jgi:Ca2+-binding EF-hand superfamily protein
MSDAELRQVMETYDTNGDGQIDYSEMQDMMGGFFGTGTSARRRE